MKKEKKRNSIKKSEPQIFESEAETIGFHMVEKIISLTISNSFKNKVDKEVQKEIFESIKSLINTYINTQFITIDKDEEEENSNLPIFEEEKKRGEKEEIDKIDIKTRKTSVLYLLNNEDNSFNIDLSNAFFSNYYRGENNWDLLSEPKENEKDRYSSTLINYLIPENKSPESKLEKVEEENLMLKTTSQLTNTNFNFTVKKRKSQVDASKKKKNMGEIMNKFSFHELPKEDFEIPFNDNLNLDELRLEKEEEIKRREEENKLRMKALRKNEEKKKEENNLFKQYEKKKLTIDPNGKIVFIKGYKIEALSKEFLLSKSNLKMLKTEKTKIELFSEKESKEIKENKENEEKEKNEKNEKIDKSDKKKEKKEKIDKSVLLPKIPDESKIILSPSQKRRDSIFSLEKKIERGPISPSGSCFDRIKLEIGVTMKENKKIKTGGKDFFLKFNKYSLETYNQKLKDNTNSFMKTQYNLTSDYQKNFNSSLENFNNSNLIQNTDNSLSTFKRNNLTSNNFLKSDILNSSLNPLIKLNGIMSLKNSMNDLDLINEKELLDNKLNRKNIFKEKDNLSKKDSFMEMNEFTSTLVSNDKWKNSFSGIKQMKPLKNPKKPLNSEIEREMGKGGMILRKRLMHGNHFSRSLYNGFGSDFRTSNTFNTYN